jgi:hypothetical protein
MNDCPPNRIRSSLGRSGLAAQAGSRHKCLKLIGKHRKSCRPISCRHEAAVVNVQSTPRCGPKLTSDTDAIAGGISSAFTRWRLPRSLGNFGAVGRDP